MTTHYQEASRCAVCGHEAEYVRISSTNTFGAPDLDTRPAEMKRSTIFAWIHRCPKCGYCASDISETAPDAASVVHSQEYTRQLSEPAIPELANSFLCKALIDERSGDYAAAAWAMIHAAWVCDDAESSDSARTSRRRAADMIDRALENGQEVAGQEGAETAVQVDLLRRAGRFDDALQRIEARRPEITEDIILRILDCQETLIARGDDACHTVSEALGQNE